MDGIVLICDQVSNRENVNNFTTNLEFTSNVYYNALHSAAKELADKVTVYQSPSEFEKNIQKHINDIIFTAIWSGELSRNRKAILPAICETNGLLYVGADAYVQSISQDKDLSKIHARQFGMKSANGVKVTCEQDLLLLKGLKYPVVVKPNFEEGSIGISDNSLKYTCTEAAELTKKLLPVYGCILVEEFIGGIEVAICIAGSSHNIALCEVVALQIDGEMISDRIWGYESKKNSKALVEKKIITDSVPQHVLDMAKKIFKSLGKVDYMRIDGNIVNNEFYLIKYTPDCSLHPDCFMYRSFLYNHKSYAEMLSKFIDCAKQNLKYNRFPRNLTL
ncbi:MAG: hypothetical protein K2J79_08760 [Ruminiclostridium sp.]|nr:hypothetical protein [Ruminiclostridium sp.]